MTPQLIHETWLVVTVISTLEIVAAAIFLCKMFYKSERRWFFLTIAIWFVFIAHEQLSAEVKNYFHPSPPDSAALGYYWLIGRVLEMIAGVFALGYLVFGRNGKHSERAR